MTNPALRAAVGDRPENRVLLAYLGVCSAERAHASLDWDYLLETASAHGVLSLFANALLNDSVAAADAGPEFTARLRRERALVVRRNFVYAQELLRLVDLFISNDIGVIPYKGAFLAATAYGDASLRQFSDLDILVKPQDLFRAKQLLEDQGYRERFIHGHRPVAALTGVQQSKFLSFNHEYEMERRDGLLIDLHWRLAPKVFPAQLDPQPMWSRLREYPMEGRRVASFCAEDMLLVLCMHGCKDVWKKLIWVMDLERTIASQPDIDWAVVFDRARESRITPQLLLGLQLVKDLFDTPLPPPATADLLARFDIPALATQVIETLFQEQKQAEWNPITRLNLKLFETPRDKLSYLLGAFFVPRVADWAVIRLPAGLYGLYYLVRPLRIGARWLKAIGTRAAQKGAG